MTGIQPAARELAALAHAMRGWDPEHTMAAMIAARNAGWDFGRVFREVSVLLLKDDASPDDLRHAARATAMAPGPRPETYGEGAAMARQLLEQRDAGSAA